VELCALVQEVEELEGGMALQVDDGSGVIVVQKVHRQAAAQLGGRETKLAANPSLQAHHALSHIYGCRWCPSCP